MDKQLFKQACDKVMISDHEEKQKRIGTLGEKTLHAVLKHYFEPLEGCHEVRVGRYIADIRNERGIIEIQTRQFNKLKSKIEHFLVFSIVTVVYPIPYTKWLYWIDEKTGEISKKRKSPKCGKRYEIFYELYKIKHLLGDPRLRLCIVLLDLEEYRFLNGWSENRKRGSSRYDRIPIDIVDEIYINDIADYSKLIPQSLEKQFTSKEFKKAAGLSLSAAQTALNVLHSIGAVSRIGKQGNLYVYENTQMKEANAL